jgi:hypothetical protein
VRRFVVYNSLGIVFGLMFLGAVVGQAFAGWHQFNDELVAEHVGTVGFWAYVVSADFAVDVAENWQSEFLQFLVYLVLTVWLLQQGSPESKEPDKVGLESKKEQKIGPYANEDSPAWARAEGWRTGVYSVSLTLMMAAAFLASWLVQSVAGWASYNEDRLHQMRDPVSWSDYLLHSDFWSRTLQNWQSEFLAVGSFAVLAIYLRQRGSPESKPVGSSHEATGVEG